MKTEIVKIKGDWEEVVDDCRFTVGKEELGHEPSTKFKRAILMSEHSPIRNISIKWRWVGIKSWIATHWSRHKWECYIKTQREDRTGVNRDESPQATLVNFKGDANIQNLIDTMRKRLCYQASPETRHYAEDLKLAIKEVEPEISEVLVPNCIYRGGCPEMAGCKFYEMFMRNHEFLKDSISLQDRYDYYNADFYKRKGKKNED